MNIPDLDGEDGQLVVRCNCRNFHNANQLIFDIDASKILIIHEAYKSPSFSINNNIYGQFYVKEGPHFQFCHPSSQILIKFCSNFPTNKKQK